MSFGGSFANPHFGAPTKPCCSLVNSLKPRWPFHLVVLTAPKPAKLGKGTIQALGSFGTKRAELEFGFVVRLEPPIGAVRCRAASQLDKPMLVVGFWGLDRGPASVFVCF